MANLTYAELVTPERVLFSGDAEAVILRADGGDTTFLANHSDFIASVDICVVRIQAARSSRSPAEGVAPAEAGTAPTPSDSTPLVEVRAAVHGGFVKVADNTVTIVAGVAELADEINVARARRALEGAEESDPAAARARVRLEVAQASKADLG